MIALLTDFGLKDGYVGIMKGVIATISPQSRCVDLTHLIPPQDLWATRFCLMNAVSFFPEGTIFLCVVDPGVGGDRHGIAVQFDRGYFVGPDNGIISGLLTQFSAIRAVRLNNPTYWRTRQPSTTFHGRDIFAPVAAYLDCHTEITDLGDRLDPEMLVTLAMAQYQVDSDKIIGHIQYIDHFGNLVTTIPNDLLETKEGNIHFRDYQIPLVRTYSEVNVHDVCGLCGSHGWLELAINQGNACETLKAMRGDRLECFLH